MTTHPGFYRDTTLGQSVYRCCQCKYDTFEQPNAVVHSTTHPPVVLPGGDKPLNDWLIELYALQPLKNVKIGVCYLTWNTDEASFHGVRAIALELLRLSYLGATPYAYWWDNGSTDHTRPYLEPCYHSYNTMLSATNQGQCVSRNWMIERALGDGCDFIVLLDGDIEIVPLSIYAMVQAAKAQDAHVGLFCYNQTDDEDDGVAQECRDLTGLLDKDPSFAWTQYGVFPARFFREGLRFDEAPCFLGPGWGVDDDDLWLQMRVKGYNILHSKYFRYLHRKRHSGLMMLPKELARESYKARRDYLISKWKDEPLVADYIAKAQGSTLDSIPGFK